MLRAAPAPAPPPTAWERVKGYAVQAEELIDAPIYDVAGITGLDVAWLGALVFVSKAFLSGIWMEFKRAERQR